MASGAVDTTVAAPPEEVWKKVGDFGGAGSCSPPSSRSASRATIASSACSAWRSASACWPATTRAASSPTRWSMACPSRATPPPSRWSPRVTGSKVIWAYNVTPDEMAPIFGDTYKAALAALAGSFALGQPTRGCVGAAALAYPDPVNPGAADAPVGATPLVRGLRTRAAPADRGRRRASIPAACRTPRGASSCGGAGPSPRWWRSTSRPRPSASCGPSARARCRRPSSPGRCARASRTSAGRS